jgi:HSP20 family protein
MNLEHYDPWRTMRQWQNEMERLFGKPKPTDDEANVIGGEWVPAVDIKEEEDRFVLHADVPGVEPENIEVSMDNGILTIKGERQSEGIEDRQNYKRIERARGTFYRRFSLPENTDPERVEAHSRHGVLEVLIPKTASRQPRKIKVES